MAQRQPQELGSLEKAITILQMPEQLGTTVSSTRSKVPIQYVDYAELLVVAAANQEHYRVALEPGWAWPDKKGTHL